MWLSVGQDKAGAMGRFSKKKKRGQGLKNPTFSGWEENELKRETKRAIRVGEDKSGDEIFFTDFINMAVIDNLYFWGPWLGLWFSRNR